MQSFLTTALHLTGGDPKEENDTPNPFLSSVLQALSVQGELHKKIKLFGTSSFFPPILFHLNVLIMYCVRCSLLTLCPTPRSGITEVHAKASDHVPISVGGG